MTTKIIDEYAIQQIEDNLKERGVKNKQYDKISKLDFSSLKLLEAYSSVKYKNNDISIGEFKIFKNIQVTKYSANNKKLLEDIKQNPLTNLNVKTSNEVYEYNELPLGLLFLFKQTKVG